MPGKYVTHIKKGPKFKGDDVRCGHCDKIIYKTVDRITDVIGDRRLYYYPCPQGLGYHLTKIPQPNQGWET